MEALIEPYTHATAWSAIEFTPRTHPVAPHVLRISVDGGAGAAVFAFHLARVGWVSLFDVADGWLDWDATGIIGPPPPYATVGADPAVVIDALNARASWDKAHAVEVEAARAACAEVRRYLKGPSAVEWADAALLDAWGKTAPRMAANVGAVGHLETFALRRTDLWHARISKPSDW